MQKVQEVYTFKTALDKLGVPPATFFDWVKKGKIQKAPGARGLYFRDSIDALLKEREMLVQYKIVS